VINTYKYKFLIKNVPILNIYILVTKPKTIFLDLDETLVHSCTYYEQPDYIIESTEVGEVIE
jgi:predicted HAD superfamily phosphohydrolase YqeG